MAQLVTKYITDAAVTNAKLANLAQGSVKVGGGSNAVTDLDASTDKQILIGDGTDVKSVAISGDIAISNTGVTAIQADTVANTMLENIAQGSIKVGGAANAPTDLDAKTDGQILVGDGTDIASVAVSGDVTLANTGAVTIAAEAVTLAKMANMATASFIARDTAGAGVPEVISKADALTLLNVADGATANAGDVTASANVTDHTLVRGDGGAKGVQDTGITVDDSDNVSGLGTVAGASKITLGDAAGTTGSIELKGTTSGTVTLKVADIAGTHTLTLPTDDGDANQAVITDGNGVLSFATPSTVDDTAYNATSWNDNNDAATKNSIRDKVETMDTAIGLNTAKNTNVPTALSLGTVNGTTVSITSDSGADDVTLPAATTTDAGMLTASLFDEIDANTAKVTNATHTGEVTGSTTLTIANKTGADTGICTGTKGTSGDLAEWNADGDIVDGPTPPTGTILGTTDTQTLTNKTITKRVQTAATAATLSVNSDSYDIAQVTAQTGACTIAAPTGTPTNGRMLLYKIQDNGTTRALTWNAIFVVLSNTTLPATTTINKWHYILTIYDTTDSKYHVLSADVEG